MRDAIQAALKEAQKSQDKTRVSTLRLICAAVKDRDIANRSTGKDPVSDEEILTDPSYAGQIVTFTFPHIGNVGTNAEDIEDLTPARRAGVRSSMSSSLVPTLPMCGKVKVTICPA